ncbi:hypothetical protein MMP74_18470 [Acinetobacter sp. NIPH 1869]|uniref:hypothetical protein n=1 Tax=Acinetobacter higginsii TaxID=70347 RepID=UPI001F4B02DE|nr:hypothetical protein [Acinetobacter higginsii]MCH7306334.1 hypothetical protein [Acinetobacter higginsii]
MQKIQIRSVKLGVASLSTMILLVCCLFPFKIYAGCAYNELAGKVTCNNIGRGEPSSSSSSNSQANTQAAIGLVQSAIGIWAEASQKQEEEREQQRQREQAEFDAQRKQERDQFNQYVDQAKDDVDTNPWANSTSDKKDKKQKQQSDIYLGTCIEQNFSSQPNGQFVLKNTCNYAINLKYIFSSSKPFSGTYSTLQPNQVTFETGKQGENVKYYMCPVPQTPQSLDGGCI